MVGSGAPFFTQLWLQFISHSRHTASESRTSQETKKRIIWPHLNFMALTDDEETKRRRVKGEEAEQMNASHFIAALRRINTAVCVLASFPNRVINTPLENT